MKDIGKSIPYRFRGRNLQHNEKYIQIGLEEDNGVNTITFILDRYYQGIDLNDFDVQLLLTGSFMPEPQADILTVNNGLVKEVDRATITLKWTVTINHTSQKGVGAGQFRFISASEEVWSTDVFGLMVGNSLEVDEVIEALFPSIISNHTARISAFEEALGNIYTKSEINALLNGKVDKIAGKELSTNDFTNELKTAYNNAVSLAHEHGNKTTLDEISNAVKERYDEAADKMHSHSNKYVIDQITEQTKSEYDDAVEKKHSHINKDVLDATEAVYTQAEKEKLAGLESSHFKGKYISLEALVAAHSTGNDGDYAHVDEGAGKLVKLYIWDTNDNLWVNPQGATADLTPSEVKLLYEANPDTNAYTNAEKNKVQVASNHSQTTGNPHGTTASDVGAIPSTQKGSANGVASLDSSGKLPTEQLPVLTMVDVGQIRPNMLINSNFAINTLGKSVYNINGEPACDGWKVVKGGGAYYDATTKTLHCVAGGEYAWLRQRMTWIDITKLIGKTITMSVRCKADRNKFFNIGYYRGTSYTSLIQYGSTTADSDFVTVTVTATIPTTVLATDIFCPRIYCNVPSSDPSGTASLQLEWAKLEIGEYATEYQPPIEGEEFAKVKRYLDKADISTVMPLSSAAASNTKVLSEKVVYDEFAKKANAENPTLKGQIEHTTNLSATNRKLPIGIYQVLPGGNLNYWKIFRITPIRALGVVLRITNFPYISNPLCFADISINTYTGGHVVVNGYKYQDFANALGTLYWTVDITNDVIDFYYKPPTNGAGIGISMSSGYNHSIVNLSFVSDGTNVLPYDTGSTTPPATPEGGSAGQLLYTDYTQLATTNNPTFTGTVTVPTPSNNTDAATKGYVDNLLVLKAPLANPIFTGNVVVPTADADNEAVNKGQMDAALALKANDNAVVKTSGNQSIAGVKTFSSSPIVPNATANNEAVNKGQMDTAIEANGNPFKFPTDSATGLSGTFALPERDYGYFQIVAYRAPEVYCVIVYRLDFDRDVYSSLFHMPINDVFGRIKIAPFTGVVTLQTTNSLASPTTWTDDTTTMLYCYKLA